MRNVTLIKKNNYAGQAEGSESSANMPVNTQQDSPNVPNIKRMSITLSGDSAHVLEFLSKSQGITQNEALRKAIATEAYIRQEVMQGATVLLQKPDGEIREVVFR
jgi:hypothetical protein